MKSFISSFQTIFPLIGILTVSSCAIGCSTVLGAAFAIGDAVKTSKAKDAMVVKKQSEEADIKSAMDLYNFPAVFKRHQFSSELYWCYPKELTENNRPSQECELDKCCEHITIEEAPYIVFNGNRISLETEESFIRRHRYLDLGKFNLRNAPLSSNDRTSDVIVNLDTVNKNFPERQPAYRDKAWRSVLAMAFPNQKEYLNEFQAYINTFNSHPVVVWVENVLPLYQQCSNSKNCMNKVISDYMATQIKPEPVSETNKAEFVYQFETRPNWCYLVFESNKDASNTTHLIDTMTSASLTTLSSYDDIQKFRAKVEYTNLNQENHKFHVEGVCSVLPTTAARKRDGFIKGSTPIILGWPRDQMPEAIAMMAEVELHELKQDNVCPLIDRSAEFTWTYTIQKNDAITIQRIPQQNKSNVNTYPVNCSHPYALIDYFKFPVPGTLVWNGNSAYVIADKASKFQSYTVLSQDGHVLTAKPELLSTETESHDIQLYNSLDAKCSCAAIDPSLPEKYRACDNKKDPFKCCEDLLRADLKLERDNLQSQYNQADDTAKASIQPHLSLLQNENYIQRQINARCGLDNTKAYDNIEKLFRLEDTYTQSNYLESFEQKTVSPINLSHFFSNIQ